MAVSLESPRPAPAVVVLRALGLGDLLTAVPALRALADAFPRHPRLLATPAALAPECLTILLSASCTMR